MKIGIIGATGYGGAELVRYLHKHPDVSIHSIHATSLHGEPLSNSYKHMEGIIPHTLSEVDVEHISKEVDLVFTATPSGVASKLAPQFIERGVKVIDLSGDFRIKSQAEYEKWYGIDAPNQALVDEAVYGLAEWTEEDLSEAQLISNPGCFPTAILLGLAPLVKNRLIDPNMVIVDAKTGVSGAGKGVSQATHYSETNDNLKIYKVNQHQHTPEIEEKLKLWDDAIAPITFSTHLVPMTRGIMATIYAQASEDLSDDELTELFKESYKDNYFVRVRESGQFPSTKEVYGSNFCDIGVTYDSRTRRITVVSVIDNLVKGASGQAIQNMNKMLNLDEKTGIDFMPVYP
ncbi:MAG TPA: N-acetyl-gamma-glutamyl-phosphate reductase [Pseudogracilibacillus sp.]|nr:N-acetyl-gamma-glutamyl-phosphate reductase [Pseudogracilibacillus sp.]